MAGALLSEKCCCFCAKTIVKASRKFELARLKKKKKKNILAVWRLSGSVLSRWFLAPLGVFLRNLFVLLLAYIVRVRAIRVYRLFDSVDLAIIC